MERTLSEKVIVIKKLFSSRVGQDKIGSIKIGGEKRKTNVENFM